MPVLSGKRKASKKSLPENPNQLSFEFSRKESEIEIHLPKQKLNPNHTSFNHTKRAFITLSVG